MEDAPENINKIGAEAERRDEKETNHPERRLDSPTPNYQFILRFGGIKPNGHSIHASTPQSVQYTCYSIALFVRI